MKGSDNDIKQFQRGFHWIFMKEQISLVQLWILIYVKQTYGPLPIDVKRLKECKGSGTQNWSKML